MPSLPSVYGCAGLNPGVAKWLELEIFSTGKPEIFPSCDRILGSLETLPMKQKLLHHVRMGGLALVCGRN